MTQVVESLKACLLNIEEHHDRIDGWRPSDAAIPTLYFLYHRDGEVVYSDLKLAPWLWGMTKTLGGFLRHAAAYTNEHAEITHLMMPNNFIGVGLACEAWCLSSTEEKDVERIAEARQIHKNVNRRESRLVLGTLLAGSTVFTVMRYRRRNEIQQYPGEDGVMLGGGVPEGLRTFADTMLTISSQAAKSEDLVRRVLDKAQTDSTTAKLIEGVYERNKGRMF